MMNMKKLNKIIAAFALFAFVSCDNFLNVPPDNRLALDSREKIHRLLVTAYPDVSFAWIAEFASDNTDRIDEGIFPRLSPLEEEAFFWRNVTSINQDTPHFIWNGLYAAIAASNHALAAIEDLRSRDYPRCLNHQEGEALITRAYSHFLLVNLFSQHFSAIHSNTDLGIPFIDAPETTVNPHRDRRTVAYVYERIKQDILAGIDLIDDTQITVAQYRFTRNAAAAFAARFFLFKADWENAEYFANRVLGNNPATLLRNWSAVGDIENIRDAGVVYVRNEPANLLLRVGASWWWRVHAPITMGGNEFAFGSFINNREVFRAPGPWGPFAQGGVVMWRNPAHAYTNVNVNFMSKFDEFFEFSDAIAGIGVGRLIHADFTTDETLLVRAEARIMQGRFADAADDINIFLNAFRHSHTPLTYMQIANSYANMSYYTYAVPTPKKHLNPDFDLEPGVQTNMIHGLLHLRRMLTLHEGLRWFDVKRYGIEIYRRRVIAERTVEVMDRLPVRDPRRAFQIPDAVIGAGLQGNPRAEIGRFEPLSVLPVRILPADDSNITDNDNNISYTIR